MKNQKGFSVVEIIIAIVVVGLLGMVAWMYVTNVNKKTDTVAQNNSAAGSQKSEEQQGLMWMQTENGWRSQGTPPDCPAQPMLKSIADTSKATSVLYPGQIRGGNYKPHGGLRFDNSTDNTVTVTAPMDAYLVRGARYIAEGEVQYTFDAINNCGIMYRVGHLREIPANLQAIANTWPEPTAGSQTSQIHPAVLLKRGATLATKVGILGQKNAFFDFGVYDLKTTNQASKSPDYQSVHSDDPELSWHAVCWLTGWLPTTDQSHLLSLPAGDPTSGKNSDYCK